MSPPPSHHRKSPPATAVLPERRNGHARALSPRASAGSRHPQEWHARPPTVGYRPATQRTTPHAGLCYLGESNHLLLLLL
jgi:hypothetical protein